jgi:hypothetical protein
VPATAANAIRWGTLYNFRFDADHPPGTAAAVIGLFRGGLGYSQVVATTLAPHPCTPVASEELGCSDGIDDDCDGLADCADSDCCTAACEDGIDADGDLVGECDCNDADPTVWSTPGEAKNLVVTKQAGTTLLSWSPPLDRGAAVVAYEVLRSTSVSDFVSPAVCLALADPSQAAAADAQTPALGERFGYLVRAENACPGGVGTGPLGFASTGQERLGRSCP